MSKYNQILITLFLSPIGFLYPSEQPLTPTTRSILLCHAASTGNLDILGHIAARDLRSIIDKPYLYSDTNPLFLAAGNGHLPVVKFLVMFADVNLSYKNSKQQTALHQAASHGRSEIVDFLLENNLSVNAKDKYGKTATDLAKEHGHIAIAQKLERACTEQLDRKYETKRTAYPKPQTESPIVGVGDENSIWI